MKLTGLERIITKYLFTSWKDANPVRIAHGKVVILMYHHVSNGTSVNSTPYYDTNTRVPVFRNHLEILKKGNYKVVSLGEVLRLLVSVKYLDRNYVAITFDDGFMSVYKNAYPLLKEYRFPATVFLVTSCVGGKSVNGCEFLGWDEAREMAIHSIEIGSHTVDHRKLAGMDETEMRHQVKHSKEEIEQRIGKHVDAFSYPYAFPERNLKFRKSMESILKQEGYKQGVTTMIGRNAVGVNPFFLKRIPVNSFDDAQMFLAKLNGGYDWVRVPQYGFKLMKDYLSIVNKRAIPNDTFVLSESTEKSR